MGGSEIVEEGLRRESERVKRVERLASRVLKPYDPGYGNLSPKRGLGYLTQSPIP